VPPEANARPTGLCRVLALGVVNVTPDSFSDGGAFLAPAAANPHRRALRAPGAAIRDVGGEATNPRAAPVSVAEELARVLPVIEALAGDGATVSVDTTKAEVARAAVLAGATIVNDVAGGLFDPAMVPTVNDLSWTRELTYIAGHLRGRTLAEVFAAERAPSWQEVAAELADRIAPLSPVARARCWIDPGLGFGKGADPEGNLALIRHAGDIAATVGRPIVIGASRKRFLRRLIGDAPDPHALDVASIAAHLAAVRAGALVVRTHNVALLRAALAVYTQL